MDVSLVPVGPLTNIALALRLEPRIASRIRRNQPDGRLDHGGQLRAPAAETNIAIDPEAAHIVFSSGIPIKMAGLNITRQALPLPAKHGAHLRAHGKDGQSRRRLLDWYNAKSMAAWGLPGAALHDAVRWPGWLTPAWWNR